MCDPITIAGIALTAGSTVANTMAENKVAKARSAAMSAERLRQQGLDREAEALNLQSQDRYGDFAQKQEERGQQLGDYLATAGTSTAEESAAASDLTPASGSAITVQEEKNQQAKAKTFTDQQAKSLGTLRSFGDYLGDVSRLQGRDASLIGQIGGFKQGSSNTVPYELDAAGHKGDSMKFFGDVLGLGGSLAIGKGLQGSFNPAANIAAAGAVPSIVGPAVKKAFNPMSAQTIPGRVGLRSLYGGM